MRVMLALVFGLIAGAVIAGTIATGSAGDSWHGTVFRNIDDAGTPMAAVEDLIPFLRLIPADCPVQVEHLGGDDDAILLLHACSVDASLLKTPTATPGEIAHRSR